MYGNQTWHAAAFCVFAAHCVARSFWCNHEHVNIITWFNQAEMDVKAVCENKGRAFFQVWRNFIVVDVGL